MASNPSAGTGTSIPRLGGRQSHPPRVRRVFQSSLRAARICELVYVSCVWRNLAVIDSVPEFIFFHKGSRAPGNYQKDKICPYEQLALETRFGHLPRNTHGALPGDRLDFGIIQKAPFPALASEAAVLETS